MERKNQSFVTTFILMGIPHSPELDITLFGIFLVLYTLTLVGNLLILTVIKIDNHLHTPMYYFLANLSFIDAWFSTVTVPKILMRLFSPDGGAISFQSCAAQLYFFHILGGSECLLYTVMSYDRYIAITYPLHYATMMSGNTCALLAGGIWLTGAILSAIQTTLTFHLPYCGPNQIEHFFCDAPPIFKLACADTSDNEIVIFVNIGILAFTCFFLIFISYVSIVRAILKIGTAQGRSKAFQTCASHCIVVLCFYLPCLFFFFYLRPGTKETVDVIVSIFFTVITPLLNPMVYTLRNKEVKTALLRLQSRGVFTKRK